MTDDGCPCSSGEDERERDVAQVHQPAHHEPQQTQHQQQLHVRPPPRELQRPHQHQQRQEAVLGRRPGPDAPPGGPVAKAHRNEVAEQPATSPGTSQPSLPGVPSNLRQQRTSEGSGQGQPLHPPQPEGLPPTSPPALPNTRSANQQVADSVVATWWSNLPSEIQGNVGPAERQKLAEALPRVFRGEDSDRLILGDLLFEWPGNALLGNHLRDHNPVAVYREALKLSDPHFLLLWSEQHRDRDRRGSEELGAPFVRKECLFTARGELRDDLHADRAMWCNIVVSDERKNHLTFGVGDHVHKLTTVIGSAGSGKSHVMRDDFRTMVADRMDQQQQQDTGSRQHVAYIYLAARRVGRHGNKATPETVAAALHYQAKAAKKQMQGRFPTVDAVHYIFAVDEAGIDPNLFGVSDKLEQVMQVFEALPGETGHLIVGGTGLDSVLLAQASDNSSLVKVRLRPWDDGMLKQYMGEDSYYPVLAASPVMYNLATNARMAVALKRILQQGAMSDHKKMFLDVPELGSDVALLVTGQYISLNSLSAISLEELVGVVALALRLVMTQPCYRSSEELSPETAAPLHFGLVEDLGPPPSSGPTGSTGFDPRFVMTPAIVGLCCAVLGLKVPSGGTDAAKMEELAVLHDALWATAMAVRFEDKPFGGGPTFVQNVASSPRCAMPVAVYKCSRAHPVRTTASKSTSRHTGSEEPQRLEATDEGDDSAEEARADEEPSGAPDPDADGTEAVQEAPDAPAATVAPPRTESDDFLRRLIGELRRGAVSVVNGPQASFADGLCFLGATQVKHSAQTKCGAYSCRVADELLKAGFFKKSTDGQKTLLDALLQRNHARYLSSVDPADGGEQAFRWAIGDDAGRSAMYPTSLLMRSLGVELVDAVTHRPEDKEKEAAKNVAVPAAVHDSSSLRVGTMLFVLKAPTISVMAGAQTSTYNRRVSFERHTSNAQARRKSAHHEALSSVLAYFTKEKGGTWRATWNCTKSDEHGDVISDKLRDDLPCDVVVIRVTHPCLLQTQPGTGLKRTTSWLEAAVSVAHGDTKKELPSEGA